MLQARRRSNSLPIPQIEISVYQGTNSNSRDSPSGNTLKDFIEVPDQVMPTIMTGKHFNSRFVFFFARKN